MNKYVLQAIESELEHQHQKYGADKPQSFPGFLLILEAKLAEAKHGWMKSHKITEARNTALAEVVQVAAAAIACLERYGVVGCPGSLNDTLPIIPEWKEGAA